MYVVVTVVVHLHKTREDVCAGSPRRADAARVGGERVEAEEPATSRPAGELQGSLVDDCRIARVTDNHKNSSWPNECGGALEICFHHLSRGGTRRGIDARARLEHVEDSFVQHKRRVSSELSRSRHVGSHIPNDVPSATAVIQRFRVAPHRKY